MGIILRMNLTLRHAPRAENIVPLTPPSYLRVLRNASHVLRRFRSDSPSATPWISQRIVTAPSWMRPFVSSLSQLWGQSFAVPYLRRERSNELART